MNEKEANKILLDIFHDYSSGIDFTLELREKNKYVPPALIRSDANGFEEIGSLYVENIGNKFYMSCGALKRVEAIETMWEKYYTELTKVGDAFNPKRLTTLAFNSMLIKDYNYNPNNKFAFFRIRERYESEASEKGVRDLCNRYIENIEKYILPTFKRYHSISSINAAINATSDTYFEVIHLFTANGLMFKKMIVAKLAGSTDFESVSQAVKRRIVDMEEDPSLPKEKYLEVWQNIYDELNKLPQS